MRALDLLAQQDDSLSVHSAGSWVTGERTEYDESSAISKVPNCWCFEAPQLRWRSSISKSGRIVLITLSDDQIPR